jgi:hypothetical protein
MMFNVFALRIGGEIILGEDMLADRLGLVSVVSAFRDNSCGIRIR